MSDPTISSWSRENDLLFQLRQLREENKRLREDQQGVDAVDTLTEEGWTWDGDQWQRPALQSAWLLESTQTLAKPVLLDDARVQDWQNYTAPPLLEQEPLEYWNAVEGWVKIAEVREHFGAVGCGTIYKTAGEDRVPVYTTPPKRPWQGLTDEDWEWVADKKETSLDTFAHGAAWAADQLKEKNL